MTEQRKMILMGYHGSLKNMTSLALWYNVCMETVLRDKEWHLPGFCF